MKEIKLTEDDLVKIRNAAQLIEGNLKYHFNIEELAERILINVNKLKMGFKIEYGVGPYTFLMQKRVDRAKILLMEKDTITSIALAMGFTGTYAESNFIKSFKKLTGITPAEWRKQQLEAAKNQAGKLASA